MRRGVRQRVTGLGVNDHANVPRDEYDRLKAILHTCAIKGPESQNRAGRDDFREHLSGRVAFVALVNPARAAKLQRLLERIQW
jgi:RNA-directed DNA polymerase